MSSGRLRRSNNFINLECHKVMSALKEKFGSYENLKQEVLIWPVGPGRLLEEVKLDLRSEDEGSD